MPTVSRPRLRHLLLLLLLCAAAVGCGVSAASGPQTTGPLVVLDTTDDRGVEPTGRAYLSVQP
jgi:hypothetical protein